MSSFTAIPMLNLPIASDTTGTGSDHLEELCALKDNLLLLMVGQGSKDALSVLFARHRRKVCNVIQRILRDPAEAEDLCQDVFVYVFQKAGVFDPTRSSAISWIIQIAYHRAFDRRRYLAIRTHPLLDSESQGNAIGHSLPWVLDEIIASEVLSKLRQHISEEQRRILELHHFDGYSLCEIADQMNLSVGCIRNRYYRTLEKLRTLLFSDGKAE